MLLTAGRRAMLALGSNQPSTCFSYKNIILYLFKAYIHFEAFHQKYLSLLASNSKMHEGHVVTLYLQMSANAQSSALASPGSPAAHGRASGLRFLQALAFLQLHDFSSNTCFWKKLTQWEEKKNCVYLISHWLAVKFLLTYSEFS